MDRNKKIPMHQLLLRDPDGLRAAYDQAASELIEAVRPEGYFEGWTAEELTWPSHGADQIGLEGLLKRARIVDAIYNGVPALRDRRLREAHDHFIELTPAYHEGNRIYLRLRDEFVGSGAGTGSDFLKLYQSLYVEALAKGDDFSPDLAETALWHRPGFHGYRCPTPGPLRKRCPPWKRTMIRVGSSNTPAT